MESKNLSRRSFLKFSALTGTALSLGFYFTAEGKDAKIINALDAENHGVELNSWIYIDTSGKVTLLSHRAEMGQGVYQSLPQIIAEELEVDLNKVKIAFAPGNRKRYGSQITGGSSSIRGSYKNLLTLSASAREMLIQAASKKWGVAKSECYAEDGNVIHKPSGRKYHYGELVTDASKLEAPKEVVLKKRSDYKLIGKPLTRLDHAMKTNGTAVFGLDKVIPGMMYAMVERNPRLRGKVKSFDATEALKIAGVKKVFKVRMGVFKTFREGVAVVATSTWAALQGKRALKVEWDDTGFEHVSTEEIFKRQEEALKTKKGLFFRTPGEAPTEKGGLPGEPAEVMEKSENTIDVIYQTPYQAHYCMEPLNCVAHYQGDKVEIWGPIQGPEMVQDFISKDMGIPVENIVVNMTFLGGGFGRKAFMDYPHEAAVISKEIGAPVQVIWTREDEATQGPFRPGISYRCIGSITNGEIKTFHVKLSGQNMDNWPDAKKDQANASSSEGLHKRYFETVKNLTIEDIPFDIPIPPMWWRSVYASTNGFAYESFIDELAIAAEKDPLEFRRQYLKEERVEKLINKLQEVSGWKNRKKGEGFGVAITECFGSTVGEVVKVSRKADGKVKIDKVWAVIDCGWFVNPDTIKAQVEGSIVMGLGAATMHEVTFKDGIAVQNNFSTYKMPRISDIPPIETHIMENDKEAGGVGEPALPPLAPALTNAIFDLTGKRIRKLPFDMTAVG